MRSGSLKRPEDRIVANGDDLDHATDGADRQVHVLVQIHAHDLFAQINDLDRLEVWSILDLSPHDHGTVLETKKEKARQNKRRVQKQGSFFWWQTERSQRIQHLATYPRSTEQIVALDGQRRDAHHVLLQGAQTLSCQGAPHPHMSQSVSRHDSTALAESLDTKDGILMPSQLSNLGSTCNPFPLQQHGRLKVVPPALDLSSGQPCRGKGDTLAKLFAVAVVNGGGLIALRVIQLIALSDALLALNEGPSQPGSGVEDLVHGYIMRGGGGSALCGGRGRGRGEGDGLGEEAMVATELVPEDSTLLKGEGSPVATGSSHGGQGPVGEAGEDEESELQGELRESVVEEDPSSRGKIQGSSGHECGGEGNVKKRREEKEVKKSACMHSFLCFCLENKAQLIVAAP